MTIGQTRIKLSEVIDHALRRCGISAVMQTPESVQIAKNNLFFLLTKWSNRGVPLWCVEEHVDDIKIGFRNYVMPVGTIDVLQVSRRKTVEESATDTVDSTSVTSEFSSAVRPVLLGYTVSADTNSTLTVEYSADNLIWTEAWTGEVVSYASKTNWIILDGTVAAGFYRVRESVLAASNITSVRWVSSYTDIPLTPFNRTEYAQLPNKHVEGDPVQYWYDRQLTPELNLWPVAKSDDFLLYTFIHRQISDVGSLTSVLEIPTRWYDATIWTLADALCMEIPGVDPARIPIITERARNTLIEVEAEETDNAHVYLQPEIGVYTQ